MDPLKAFDIINHSLLLTNPNAYAFLSLQLNFLSYFYEQFSKGKCKK